MRVKGAVCLRGDILVLGIGFKELSIRRQFD